MSLITCCPSCGTKFRVVADQLRISDGWVRCGRCQEVFDAQQALTPIAAPVASNAQTQLGAKRETQIAEPGFASASTPHATGTPLLQTASVAVSAPSVQPVASPWPAVQSGEPSAQPNLDAGAARPVLPVTSTEQMQPPPQGDVRSETDAAPPSAPAVSGYELPVPPEAPEADLGALSQPMPYADDDWLDQPTLASGDAGAAQVSQLTGERKEPVLNHRSENAASDPVRQSTHQMAGEPKLWEPEKALHAEESQAGMWAEVVRFIHPPKPAQPSSEAHFADAAQSAVGTESMQPADLESPAAHDVPSFVKQAQRRAWWNKPGVRFALGMLLVFLPLSLVLQIVVHERNRLAAWQPQWREGLQAMCVLLRCEISPHRDIHAVVLTGSAFAQDALPNHYKLDLSMQNLVQLSVATPAVELTLTDAQGQVLVRKVLQPTEIGAPAELAGRGEWNGTLPVKTQGLNLPVSGYRVTAFYP